MKISLLLLFVLLFGCVLAQKPNYRILCPKLKPVQELDISQLSGSWLTIEALLLENGFPKPNSDVQHHVCVRTNIFEASNSGLSMLSEVHKGASFRRSGHTKLIVTNTEQPGRWDMQNRRSSLLKSEMLVLAAQPSEFLVLAFCQPMASTAEEGDAQPALWVKILARESRLQRRELTSLRSHIAHMLGVHELATMKFNTSC